MFDLLVQICCHAEAQPGKPALVGDNGFIFYGQLPDLIKERMDILRKNHVRVAGLQMDNGPDWVLWDIALTAGGFVCVPLPSFFTLEQMQHAQRAAGIDHVITAEGLRSTGTGAAVLPPGTSKVTFTSGTTDTPKGVCLPQKKLEQTAKGIIAAIGAEYADQHLSILPLSILLENIAGVYSALLAGCTCHLYSLQSIGFADPFRPDFEKLESVLRDKKITSAILVPELLRGLMRAVALRKSAPDSLKFLAVGGAKVAPELVVRARSLGLPVYEGYGLSECGSVVALNTPDHDELGTVGKILPHVDLSIRNGEIIVNNPAFLGYIREEHKGGFATGDLGNIDGRGYLMISGRSKNVIITSFGRNISPEWVESALLACPEVAQAVVYGDARRFPSVLIVPSRQEADIAAAVAQANKKLPDYAKIDGFHLVPPFTPQNGLLTATGRPRRAAIFEQYHSLITQEDSSGLLRATC